tara:strand:- start:792 stop:1235 length:444 start_codon:yes stop_codon:yes gene_type:complete
MSKIPTAVKLISILGIVPFLFGVLSTFRLSVINPSLNTFLLNTSILYAALILSFLGGCIFGFECLSKKILEKRRLWIAITPTIWALIALNFKDFSASILAVGFLVAYEFDRKAKAAGVAPDWWLSLRLPLTTIVVLALCIIGFYDKS